MREAYKIMSGMEKAKRFFPPSLAILELRVINGRFRIEKRKLYFTRWRVNL